MYVSQECSQDSQLVTSHVTLSLLVLSGQTLCLHSSHLEPHLCSFLLLLIITFLSSKLLFASCFSPLRFFITDLIQHRLPRRSILLCIKHGDDPSFISGTFCFLSVYC